MRIGTGQFVYMAMMQDSVYQVKIGHSQNPISRERRLFDAGVPEPYHMLHVWAVEDMLHVERNVIHPWLHPFRNLYGKEIFHLDMMYPDLIDPEIWDSVNGLNLANRLAGDINAYLTKCGVPYQQVWYNNLVQYDAAIQEEKKQSKPLRY